MQEGEAGGRHKRKYFRTTAAQLSEDGCHENYT